MPLPKRTVKVPSEGNFAQLLAVLESRTKLLAFFFGLCFVAALLVLAIWFPEPTSFQYTVFRITLALAASGVAGVIPSMIRLKVQPGAALLIYAGGALAVFVIVYIVAPAPLHSELPIEGTKKEVKPAFTDRKEKQTVLINNNQSGNIQINNYGLTKEQLEATLRKQLEETEKRKRNANEIQTVILEQQLNDIHKQLDNIKKIYAEELEPLRAAAGVPDFHNMAVTSAVKQTEGNAFEAHQQVNRSNTREIANKTRIVEVQDRSSYVLSQPYENQYFDRLIKQKQAVDPNDISFGVVGNMKVVSFRNKKDNSLKLYCLQIAGKMRTTITCNGQPFTLYADWEEISAERVCFLQKDDGRIRVCHEISKLDSAKNGYVYLLNEKKPVPFTPSKEWTRLAGGDKICSEELERADVPRNMTMPSLNFE